MASNSGSLHSARLRDLGRPVVHLGVDVDGVLAVPGRLELVVPDALQVGRLAAGAARRDQQVAAVLEEQGGERGIGRCLATRARARRSAGPRPAAGRGRATRGGTALVVGDVRRAKLVERFAVESVEVGLAAGDRVGRDIAEVDEVGRGRENQRGTARVLDLQLRRRSSLTSPSVSSDAEVGGELHFAFDDFARS